MKNNLFARFRFQLSLRECALLLVIFGLSLRWYLDRRRWEGFEEFGQNIQVAMHYRGRPQPAYVIIDNHSYEFEVQKVIRDPVFGHIMYANGK